MKRIIAALACLVATLALGLLIVRATSAEAPRPANSDRSSGSAPAATPSPTACPLAYTYTVLSGLPVTATNLLAGSQCYRCIVPVDLPFPFIYYGQTYDSVNIASQGNLQFATTYTGTSSCPFPYPQLGPAIMPYWQDIVNTYWPGTGDPCLMYFGQACGVYTSTSGTAPDRIFNVQWLGVFGGSNHELVNFEARLHETTGIIDFTYGFGIWYGAAIGVQNGAAQFTTYSCNVRNIYYNLLIRWTPASPACASTFTPTPTPTPTATPIQCSVSYTYTISSGFPAGTSTLLAGSQCTRCVIPLGLPFPFTFYGQTYMTANVATFGNLQFTTTDTSMNSCPPPYPQIGPAIYPYWFDGLDTSWAVPCQALYGRPCGIYTSVSGSAPDRIFNIEWFARWSGSNHETANFEIRMHEGTGLIDFVYGGGIMFGDYTTVGVQDGAGHFTGYSCDVSSMFQYTAIHWTPTYSGYCPTSTPTATQTPTSTPTAITTGTPTATPVLPGGTGTPTLTHVAPIATETATARGTAARTATSTVTGIVTGTATGTARPTITSCPVQFSDVPEGSTFYSYVRCLACRSIVSGYPDGTFRPNNNVTRGQLSKIVSNSAGFNDPQTVQMFEDVSPGATFFVYIGRLASREYMSGYPCGAPGEPCMPPRNLPYFRTNNNATRGQISKIDSNAARFTEIPSGQSFQDMPPGSTFYTYTKRLASRSIMQGYPCGSMGEPCVPPGNLPYFRPNNNATRGQTAKIVSNTFFSACQTPTDTVRPSPAIHRR